MTQFCDASVPVDRAEMFGHWAAKLMRWPPPDRIHESLQLRLDPAFGTHAVSQRHYKSGELVLQEGALLLIPDLPRAERAQLERRFGSRAPFLSPGLSVDWRRVSADVRRAALGLFWAHPLVDPGRRTEMLAGNLEACEALRECHAGLRDAWEAPELMRFLHIVDLNIHRDDEIPGHADFSGIFVMGSKFSHSCCPNCSWSFSEEGCLQYHAVRPIAPGELFTFSYVGNGMNLMVSTLERRHRLGSLWFVCGCSRCTGPDLARQMRCPSCGAARLLPEYPSGGPEWDAERPLRELIPDAEHWSCGACGGRSPAAALPLCEERELAELVPRAMQGAPERTEEDSEELLRLRARAAATVGTGHWTFALATFAWLQKCHLRLRHEPLVAFGEADLRAACGQVASWLAACAPLSSEQRFSALFLALRLARELGGGLRDWGYEPADPLGSGLEAAARLRAHGWRLSEGAVEGGRDGPEEAPAPAGGAPRRPRAGARPFCALWRPP